jgi:5-methylcytosine-specific restriction endonuclease McrA
MDVFKARDLNLFRQKAEDTIGFYAKNEGMTPGQFGYAYGLTLDYITMLFSDAYVWGKCLVCLKPFRHNLDDNLQDFVLVKIQADKPPTRSNVRVICRTCNVAKGSKDLLEYDLELLERIE